ncbi:S-protein homolog 21 [Linum grandiflorum]
MLVHCKSGDEDVGRRYIVAGGYDYEFFFLPNMWGTTLYWCHVWPDANTHVSFTAWADDDPLIPAGNLADVTWLAKDDGIYVKRRIRNEKEFRFYRKWSYGKQ